MIMIIWLLALPTQMKFTKATMCLTLLLSLGWGKHFLIKMVDPTDDKNESTIIKEEGEDYGNPNVAVKGVKGKSVKPQATPGAPAMAPPTRPTTTTTTNLKFCDWSYGLFCL